MMHLQGKDGTRNPVGARGAASGKRSTAITIGMTKSLSP